MFRSVRSPRPAVVLLLVATALGLALAGCGKKAESPTAPAGVNSELTGARVMSAEHPLMQRAMKVQEDYTLALMADADVVGTGAGLTDDGRAAVVVFTARAGVSGLPASLDGVPVVERAVGIVRPYATLQMGSSTGNDKECAAGTLGCVVIKGGTKYFLSNNHVFARQNAAKLGERIDAPGRYDAKPQCAQTPQCASLSAFKSISFSSNNTIDAAIAAPVGVTYACGERCGYTPSSTTAAAFVGQQVKKCGRTSGLTTGTVQAINVTIRVQYTSGVATFVNQIMTPGNFIRSGDSGSLMVENPSNKPVGLCFAGGTGGSFSNPIGSVLSYFNATVCNQ